MRVELNRDKCIGHGLCMLGAPDLFDLDDEGVVVLIAQPDSPALLESAATAQRDCPEHVISLVR